MGEERLLSGRARLGSWLVHLRDVVHNAIDAVVLGLLRPDDLIALTNHRYARLVERFDPAAIPEDGLDLEAAILEPIARLAPGRRLLDVCCGAGREAVLFARRDWEVTALDREGSMIERARVRAASAGLAIRFLASSIEECRLDDRFDVVYLSPWMYETFPGRERRLALLARLAGFLGPGGLLVFGTAIRWEGSHRPTRAHRLARAVALGTRGNRSLQPGDRLRGHEFEHHFAPGELGGEVALAGLEPRLEIADPRRGLRFHLLARKVEDPL